MFGQITAPLQLREHPEHGQQVLRFCRIRGAVQQPRLHRSLELLIEVIDVRVRGNEDAGGLVVATDHCMRRPRDGVLDEREELDHVAVDKCDADRRLSLTADRAQDPVRPLRTPTTDAAIRRGFLRRRSVLRTVLAFSYARELVIGKRELRHTGHRTRRGWTRER